MGIKLNTGIILKGLNCAMGITAKGIRIIVPIAVAAFYNKSTIQSIYEEIRYNGDVGYDETVKAITNSDMFDSDKCKAIGLLTVDGSKEYYKAVCSVVRSEGFSSSKLKMIEAMNTKFSEKAES